ncbi:MAG TPA: hypothetical protein VF576_00245, partial [Rubricoccaceae bacterium]
MRELITQIHALLTPRERRNFVVLFALMMGGAVLEMVGVAAIPAFVAVLADPTALDRVPGVGAYADRAGLDTPERLVIAGALALFVLFAVKNLYLVGLSWVQARYVFHRQV